MRRLGRSAPGAQALRDRYRQHVADWSSARITDQWPLFREELEAILAAVERSMSDEEKVLRAAGVLAN